MRLALAVSALVASVAANNYTFPPGFNLNLVEMGMRRESPTPPSTLC